MEQNDIAQWLFIGIALLLAIAAHFGLDTIQRKMEDDDDGTR